MLIQLERNYLNMKSLYPLLVPSGNLRINLQWFITCAVSPSHYNSVYLHPSIKLTHWQTTTQNLINKTTDLTKKWWSDLSFSLRNNSVKQIQED